MKNTTKTSLIIGVVVVVVALLASSRMSAQSDPDVVSRKGIHWHSTLAIYVKGEKLEIPANIGLGKVHLPMHTHVEDAAKGVIHLEFSGLVRRDDLKLGNFFRNWNKDMRSLGTNMKMTVNGNESMDYEDYHLRDGDVIELRYE